MACYKIFLVLALAMVALAFPAAKRQTLTGGKIPSKDLMAVEDDFGPLEEVSKVLDRYARQVADVSKKPNGAKGWTPLHRAVLRGALQVTKQLLGYEGWTPNHLELLKGEREILLEHVFDESSDNEIPENNGGEVSKEGGDVNAAGLNNEEAPSNGGGGAPENPQPEN